MWTGRGGTNKSWDELLRTSARAGADRQQEESTPGHKGKEKQVAAMRFASQRPAEPLRTYSRSAQASTGYRKHSAWWYSFSFNLKFTQLLESCNSLPIVLSRKSYNKLGWFWKQWCDSVLIHHCVRWEIRLALPHCLIPRYKKTKEFLGTVQKTNSRSLLLKRFRSQIIQILELSRLVFSDKSA